MKKPERSTYTAIDFTEWATQGRLILTPKFQRRGVWTTPARSYLIQTLLLGMPVPPIYLRVVQNADKRHVVREVVDGQQRIAAVLGFIRGDYALSRSTCPDRAGSRYQDLTETERDQIAQYPFMCEVFYGIEDREVLQIFARLNTYSVRLNAQELRNGRFFGPFKQSAYSLALEHLEFWRNNHIFSERNIARMSEVELTSELMILQLAGLQDKKKTIDDFYEQYDEAFPEQAQVEKRFRETIDFITRASADTLQDSEFHRPPLFYSLFSAAFHRLFRLPGTELPRRRTGRPTRDDHESLANAVQRLSTYVSQSRGKEAIPSSYDDFVLACLRQTDNIGPRSTRFRFIYEHAFKG